MRIIAYLITLLVVVRASSNSAVYTLTQGSPNYLNIFAVDSSTGLLSYFTQISTQGNGSTTGVGSENSLLQYGGYLFAVNPGSNSLSLFQISQTDATQVTFLGTGDTNYDFPNSVTASGNIACVVTSGANNGIRCFTFGQSGLSVVDGSDQPLNIELTTPPAFHTGPAMIAFDPNGTHLVVSVKNMSPPLPGPSVFLFRIASGVPTLANQIGPKGNVPFGFTFDSEYVVLTDAAPYGGDGGVIPLSISNDLVEYANDNFTVITGQQAACWVIYNSNNNHFYTSNAASASISELARTGTTFTVVNSYPLGNATAIGGVTDSDILHIGGTDYFYQVAAHAIYVLQLGSGTANVIQTLSSDTNGNTKSGIAAYTAPGSIVTTTTSQGTSANPTTGATTTTTTGTTSVASAPLPALLALALAAFTVIS